MFGKRTREFNLPIDNDRSLYTAVSEISGLGIKRDLLPERKYYQEVAKIDLADAMYMLHKNKGRESFVQILLNRNSRGSGSLSLQRNY